jgi:hypothetical protein
MGKEGWRTRLPERARIDQNMVKRSTSLFARLR